MITEVYFWPLKFGIVFILALYILNFLFWHFMFDNIFILALTSIYVNNLIVKCQISDVY